MRDPDIYQHTLFSTVSPEERVPMDHPFRPIRELVDTALKAMDHDFDALYTEAGRDSIPPEKLLHAQLLMVFYAIHSER
jgi:transposase